MADYIALGASFAFIGGILGIASLLNRAKLLAPYATRKLIHIGVSHWWLIYVLAIKSRTIGLIGPAVFVVINLLSLRLGLLRAMEDPEDKKNWGTVLFPIALIFLIGMEGAGVLTRGEALVGVVALGWGDGMAAVLGRAVPSATCSIFGGRKSLVGSGAMFLFSFVAILLVEWLVLPNRPIAALLVAGLATALFVAMVEIATPLGFDNLTVPVLGALFFAKVSNDQVALVFIFATVANSAIALAAYKRHAVSASGAIIGTLTATLLFVAGGTVAYLMMIAFFISSTFLGKIVAPSRNQEGLESKGNRRDGIQVLSNAGSAAVAAFAFGLSHEDLWLIACACGLAAANADTWASELGALARRKPRSILSGKEVQVGASGGVTATGFAAAATGSIFIAIVFVLAARGQPGFVAHRIAVAASIAIAGFLGSVLDSLLGDLFQAKYRCAVTGRYTERPYTDGVPNHLVKGWHWFTNDMVNLASTVFATAGAVCVFSLVR